MNLDKAAYSLDEAASLIPKEGKGRILRLASEGSIQLYAAVPEHLALFSVDSADLAAGNGATPRDSALWGRRSPPTPMREIRFVELHAETCAGFLNNGFAQQDTFKRALNISNDGGVQVIHASRPKPLSKYSFDPPSDSLLWLFACFERGWQFMNDDPSSLRQSVPLSVSSATVYLLRSTLAHLIDCSPEAIFDPAADIPLRDAPHISQNLRALRQFMIDQWRRNEAEGRPMPPARELMASLMGEYGIKSEKRALAAAHIVTNSFKREHADGRSYLSAPALIGLIGCANIFWKIAPKDSSNEPKNAAMIEWLQKRSQEGKWLDGGRPLHSRMAEGYLALIRPEFATKAGRKRSPEE